MMSYPVMHYCGRICLEDVYRQLRHMTNEEGNKTWTIRYYVPTISWFILSLIGAVFIPGISKVVSLVGALAAFFILGFPGICMFRYGLFIWVFSDEDKLSSHSSKSDIEDVDRNADPNDPPQVNARSTQSNIKSIKISDKRKGYFYLVTGCVYMVCCAFIFGQSFTQGLFNLF